MALAEDAARHDITSRSVIPRSSRIKAAIIAKAPGTLAGIDVAARAFTLQDHNLSARPLKKDGSAITPGQAVLAIEGSTRSIFAAERTALNILGHLCGVATLTRAFVERARGTRAAIYDTRKTLPGLRLLEKYAVRMGGGRNHRLDLSDAVLIKTNHLRALRQGQRTAYSAQRTEQIQQTIELAKQIRPKRFVQIEVVDLKEFKAALQANPDAILLDNWSLPQLRRAIQALNAERSTLNARPLLEVSGSVTLANVRAIAATGVERISIGRLTHSAPSLDVSLQIS